MSMGGFGDVGMDDFDIDLSKANEGLPPEGIAILQVIDVKKGRSKANNPQFIWEIRVCEYREGPGVGTDCEALDTITYFTAVTRNALWKVDEIIRALGVPVTEEGRATFKRPEVLGVLMLGSLKKGEYNGRPQCNIESLRAYPGDPGKKAPIPDKYTNNPPTDQFGLGASSPSSDGLPF